MNLEVVNLLASAPAVLWGLVDSEISVLKAALADSKAALADSKAANARELTLVQVLAANEYAALQHSLDMSRGLLSVRAVLEQIAFDFMSLAKSSRAGRRSTTEALSDFCRQPAFVAYLKTVSQATQIQVDKIADAANAAYSLLSASIHNGIASATNADVRVPSEVFPNAVTMVAVSAIFKFSRRDVRFYVQSSDVPVLPSPERTPTQSAPTSACTSADASAAPTAVSSPSKEPA